MFRIVRTTTLAALRAKDADLADLQCELDIANAATGSANDAVIRMENLAETQLRQLAQAHADRSRPNATAGAARADRDKIEAETRSQLAEIHADVARLQDAVADATTGDSVRGALAYRMLRDLYADAKARGLEPGRPFDLVAIVLGFDTGTPERRPCGCPDCMTAARRPTWPALFSGQG
ncbi:hypothetical protein ABT330_33675 [Streptomyces sp. NPDC000658]|uniref:hypothetical protein n=1 Tax=Streptomyces sp. NPDC000658 TaxID=3154266 RepID=UPI00332580EE